MQDLEDFNIKRKRIINFCEKHGVDGVIYHRKDNFAWITNGGYHGIPYETELGEAFLLFTEKDQYLITNEIEANRIKEEEIANLPFQIIEYPWYKSENEVLEQFSNYRLVADFESEYAFKQEGKLSELRFQLTPYEIEKYRMIGKETAEVVESYCIEELQINKTEKDIKLNVEYRLQQKNLKPTVTLVGCDERIDQYRHPVATNNRFLHKAMIIVCAERDGLTVALTRMVHRGSFDQELEQKMNVVTYLDAELIDQSDVGNSVSSIFHDLCDRYQKMDYSEEWKKLHQGGAIGYQNRDYLASLHSENTIKPNQAFAWNPSITGVKSEDTIIVYEDDSKEIITQSNTGWPLKEIKTSNGNVYKRPDILII